MINDAPFYITPGGSYEIERHDWNPGDHGDGYSYISVINADPAYFDVQIVVWEYDEEHDSAYAKIDSSIRPGRFGVCTDSDEGKEYYVSGETYNPDDAMMYTDYCMGSRLVEYFCAGEDLDSAEYSCPNNCFGGACLSTVCSDGKDNDFDGYTDYPEDKGCDGPDDDSELTACQDGIDNDGDGRVDLNDPGCYGVQDTSEYTINVQCDDGIDNDNDGYVDYPEDTGCSSLKDNDERTECQDGVDNDGDGRIDYPDDPGCFGAHDTSELNADRQCDDGIDNDNDGQIDYPDDPGCSGPYDNDEFNVPLYKYQCGDGIDNDNDGFIDYPDDNGCTSMTDNDERTECQDGIDNDGDGKADLRDPGCFGIQDTSELNMRWECDDGRDNDGDGFTDHPDDFGCSDAMDSDERTACQDGVDNDGDTYVDMKDPGCFGIQAASELNPGIKCDDGIDNDGDGLTDYPDDPGCTGVFDNDEYNAPPQKFACEDGIDNDGDGRIDYPNDPGCYGYSDNSELNTRIQCDDGLDNDGDGLVDYPDDPGCVNPYDNDEYNAPPSRTRCSDGIDNDNDGLTDYPDDPGCYDQYDNTETNPDMQCDDGRDNDLDGFKDYPQDRGCISLTDNDERTECQDGVDNDFDGKTDLADPGCVNVQDTSEYNYISIFACSDEVDNDGDGLIDYPDDPGCVNLYDNDEYNPPVIIPDCNDSIDNDGDGLTDYPGDPGCSGYLDDDEYNEIPSACNDGQDNDGDGYTDYPDDAGCSTPVGNTERTHCQDGVDNDGDGRVDMSDAGCYGAQDNTELNQNIECDDGIDNDGDGLVDYPRDPGCGSPTDDDESQQDNGGDVPVASAYADPSSGDAPLRVYFTGGVSGGDSPYTYRWTFDDGTTSSSRNPTHTYTDSGTYTASFRVTDDDGDIDTDTVTIRVYSDGNDEEYPTAYASASPMSGNKPLTVYFTGEVYGGDWPYTYRWTFGDGSSSTGRTPTHTYASTGTYTASFRVTDDDGDTDTESVTINVYSGYESDIPTAYAYVNPSSGKSPLTVAFSGFVAGGNSPYTYYWIFGDGRTSSALNPSNTYTSSGTYNVIFRVRDADGDESTARTSIRVDPPDYPPEIKETQVSVMPGFLNTASCKPVTGYIKIQTAGTENFEISMGGVPAEWLDYDKNVAVSGEKIVHYIANPQQEGRYEIVIHVKSSKENFEFVVPLWVGRQFAYASEPGEVTGPEGTGGLTGFFTLGSQDAGLLISTGVIILVVITAVLGYMFFKRRGKV
jgi:PKD repeat protein